MNERSFILSASWQTPKLNPLRTVASRSCRPPWLAFAKRGFHQTSMHDISAEAGISVGLIYRYFENKEGRHFPRWPIGIRARSTKSSSGARQAPNLLEGLEILFTAHLLRRRARASFRHLLSIFTRRRRAIHKSPIWCAAFCKRQWMA